MAERQAEQKRHHDGHADQRSYKMGDNVMARNFLKGPKWLPGVAAEVKEPLSYIVQMKNGTMWRRHVNQLRNGIADIHVDDVPLIPDTNCEPTISSTNESSKSSETQSTKVTSMTKVTESSRYPQRNHNPPDRYIEHY